MGSAAESFRREKRGVAHWILSRRGEFKKERGSNWDTKTNGCEEEKFIKKKKRT